MKKIEKRVIPFVKMHGIGNDYVYIDALRGETPCFLGEALLPDLSRKISDIHFGVGSDGLILILPSDIADFRMRIFNADGSEAKMCGNGVRCVGKYVFDKGFTDKHQITVETESGIKQLFMTEGTEGIEKIEVDMGSPYFKRKEIPVFGDPESEMKDFPVEVEGRTFHITGVGMGNPHGVIFVENVDDLDLPLIGPVLENLSIWPDRANIEFVEVISPDEIKVRVWERGSEETWACGTGACASAVASFRKGLTKNDVTVHLRGGDLRIYYDESARKVLMTGPAEFICEGKFYLY